MPIITKTKLKVKDASLAADKRTVNLESKSNTLFKDIVATLRESHVLLQEGAKDKLAEDSLDAQVDRFIISYEADSKPIKKESFDFRDSVRIFLSEGEDESKEDVGKKLAIEDIDMANFVNNVVRLITNYDSLLEIQDTILKRAANFLQENYDEIAVKAYKDELLDTHSIEISKTRKDREESYLPPKAGLAGPAGGAA